MAHGKSKLIEPTKMGSSYHFCGLLWDLSTLCPAEDGWTPNMLGPVRVFDFPGEERVCQSLPMVALVLPTSTFNHLQGFPKPAPSQSSSSFHTKFLELSSTGRISGSEWWRKTSCSWDLGPEKKKKKNGTYMPGCAWKRWGKRENSPDSLMSTAPQRWK